MFVFLCVGVCLCTGGQVKGNISAMSVDSV